MTRKSWTFCLCLVALLGGVASTARAQSYPAPNVVGREPAGTLLLPYFEVNLVKTNGLTTVFSINNASATAVLAHVNVMTDLGVLAAGFNVYLTGYDVQTINLRDIINGILPRTASAGQDPGDQISPKGQFSQDINFASCSGQLPPVTLPADFVTHMKNSLTGKASTYYGGKCVGRTQTDGIARGYVTIDTVNYCSLEDPAAPAYTTSTVTYQNVLWGDAYYLDAKNGVARAAPIVSVGVNPTDPETSVAGQYTFYGRYDNYTAADRRQPLATTFVARYQKGDAFAKSSSVIVWRDPKVAGAPFTCGTAPAFYPIPQEQIVAFDEQENPSVITGTPFGAMTQRVAVGGSTLPVPGASGFLYLNLSHYSPVTAGNNPPEDPAVAQAWAASVIEGSSAKGGYQAGVTATALDSATSIYHSQLPVP
ncbi:MAG: hypothetical protein U0610_13005 [bacterium]